MSIDVAKLMLRYERMRLHREANASVSVKPRTVREQSTSEREAKYHPQGYFVFFCIHERHKFGACASCKRTRSDGEAIRRKMLAAKR
jgi:hypothetical protein